MSCRSTFAGSAATTFARLNSGLNDVQTLSAFHVLRAQGRDLEGPNAGDWSAWVAQERTFVEHHPNVSDARRTSLIRRLDEAGRGAVPDGPTWNALRGIRSLSQVHTRELTTHLALFSARTGLAPELVRSRFEALTATVDTARTAPLPDGVTDDRVAECRRAQLPTDRATVYALAVLDAETLAMSQLPRRITLEPVVSEAIAKVGWDPNGGRLEVVFHSNTNRVHAYRNVPESVYQEMRSGSAGQVWNSQIRGNTDVHYRNLTDSEADAYQTRCGSCGQFAGRAGHLCPAVAAASASGRRPVPGPSVARPVPAAPRPSAPAAPPAAPPVDSGDIPSFLPDRSSFRSITDEANGVTVRVPSLRTLRPEMAGGPVAVPYHHFAATGEAHGGSRTYTVDGNLIFDTSDSGGVDVSAAQLRCTCLAYRTHYDCAHVNFHQDSVRRALNPKLARLEDIATAQADAQTALLQDWTRSVESAQEARDRWVPSAEEDSYGTNFLAFNDDVRAAVARQDAGQDPIPYLTENATNGLCSPDGGRAFGVEIEYDFPEHLSDRQRREQNAAIGAALWQAGLIPTSRQGQYHAAEDRGYTTEHEGGWSFEDDATVDGEIVSPIMYDTPETWANLQKVCDIVKAHGGTASARTGAHVHVSAGDYDHTPENHTELVRMFGQHEDVLYRLAANPERGLHRGAQWCRPNDTVPPQGFTDVSNAHRLNKSHNIGLNLQSVSGGAADHVEFRHWDGSLDPAVIQAQVKVSAAMTAAAVRNAGQYGPSRRGNETVGSHSARQQVLLKGSRRKMNRREREQDTATLRSLADTLFSRRADKAQFAALFAVTRWQPKRIAA